MSTSGKYVLTYHLDVQEDIRHIPENIKARIKNAIEKRLLPQPHIAGVPLRRSLKGYWKLRVGDYRVIYAMRSSEIVILKIGHRREVYQKFW